jgi:long-subunit acyl-CoA synthetase (AMP-forming)
MRVINPRDIRWGDILVDANNDAIWFAVDVALVAGDDPAVRVVVDRADGSEGIEVWPADSDERYIVVEDGAALGASRIITAA